MYHTVISPSMGLLIGRGRGHRSCGNRENTFKKKKKKQINTFHPKQRRGQGFKKYLIWSNHIFASQQKVPSTD